MRFYSLRILIELEQQIYFPKQQEIIIKNIKRLFHVFSTKEIKFRKTWIKQLCHHNIIIRKTYYKNWMTLSKRTSNKMQWGSLMEMIRIFILKIASNHRELSSHLNKFNQVIKCNLSTEISILIIRHSGIVLPLIKNKLWMIWGLLLVIGILSNNLSQIL